MKNVLFLPYFIAALLLAPCGYSNEAREKTTASDPIAVVETTTENGTWISSTRYYDANGKPTLGKEGYFEKRYQISIHPDIGEKHLTSYFGVDGKPTLGNEGYFEKRYEKSIHPDIGEIHLTSYLGVDGKLIKSNEGFAKMRTSQSGKTFEIVEYFDENDQPFAPPLSEYGVAKTETTMDEETGDPLEVRHYGPDGKPMNCKDGFSVMKCDSIPLPGGGTRKRGIFYDADGNCAKLFNLSCGLELIMNSEGEDTGGLFFDEKGATCETTLNSLTFASWRKNKGLQLFGKQITEDLITLYNLHGNPVKTVTEKEFQSLLEPPSKPN